MYAETGLVGEEGRTTQHFLWAFTFLWSSFILIPVAISKLSLHLPELDRCRRGWERLSLFSSHLKVNIIFLLVFLSTLRQADIFKMKFKKYWENLNGNKENNNSTTDPNNRWLIPRLLIREGIYWAPDSITVPQPKKILKHLPWGPSLLVLRRDHPSTTKKKSPREISTISSQAA